MREEYLDMKPAVWLTIKDNPIQRDTELRLRKASCSYLKNSAPTHKHVVMAQLPNGDRYVVDGHTRTLAWKRGLLQTPDLLKVLCFHVENIDEVISLYKLFDNAKAAETGQDKVSGAFKGFGFVPKSALLQRVPMLSILALLTPKTKEKIDVYKDIEPFIPVLRVIDSLMLKNSRLPASFFAAFVLTTLVFGDDYIEFWTKYINNDGSKSSKGRDPVQALIELHLTGIGSLTSGADRILSMEKSLSCFDKYRKDEMYDGGVRGLSMNRFIQANKRRSPNWLVSKSF